jgi:peroxiredoxin Q/BCP
VVLFFFPKDGTPVCTREVCHFRDSYEDFTAAGAEVIGVSGDSVPTHHSFAAHHQVPFRLLSDTDGSLRKAFGVPRTLGLFPGRTTYVIDPQGVVRHAFNAPFQAAKHITEALRVLRDGQ